MKFLTISAAIVVSAAVTPVAVLTAVEQTTPQKPDVIFVPTPPPVVDAMLEMAQVRDGDILYDLGSGDGRIPISAAKKHKIRAHLVRCLQSISGDSPIADLAQAAA